MSWGKAVSDFESDFASYRDGNYTNGVNTGTDALVIALRPLGIGRGDKVIAPANTFHATVAAIELAGADEDIFLIETSALLEAVRSGKQELLFSSFPDAARTQMVLDAARRSSELQRAVNIESATRSVFSEA